MNKFSPLAVFFLAFVLLGCSFAPKESPTPTPDFAPPTPIPPQISSKSMAIILVSEGQFLNAHLDPNKASAIVATIPANTVEIPRTGEEKFDGEVLWAKIQASTGEASWVDARYLTEYIPPADFCLDSRISFLLEDFKIALKNEDGELFASLVSPAHGLDFRYYRYGTLANYTPEEAAWVFQSDYAVNWGNEPGSGFEKIGTFSEIPLPMLLEVFDTNYELYCNDAGVAENFAPEPWIYEYANINFYQVLKPGTEQYDSMDWRSWLVGIEYVKNEPYLFALIHFEWEP